MKLKMELLAFLLSTEIKIYYKFLSTSTAHKILRSVELIRFGREFVENWTPDGCSFFFFRIWRGKLKLSEV